MKNLKNKLSKHKTIPILDPITVQVFIDGHTIKKQDFSLADISIGDTLEIYIETEPSE